MAIAVICWQIKLGVVFSSDNIHYWKDKNGERQHQILKREYVSYIGSAEVFKKHLYACAYRNGYGTYRETVLLSDGAAWIANMAEGISQKLENDEWEKVLSTLGT